VGKSASCVAQNLQSLTIRCERKSSPPQQDGEVLQEEEEDAAAFRWAVVTTDAMGIGLQLQTLPASASALCEKPALRKKVFSHTIHSSKS
jgi:hypothetical protein